jgi:ABC-type lipoprotein release transport system permease subunit
MVALRIRLRAQLRARWRSWLTISILAGVLGGLVIGTAAASKRTHGSYRRYLDSINGADVYVDPFVTSAGDSIPIDQVARLPQVADSERSVQLGVLARGRQGKPVLPAGQNQIGWVLPTDRRRLDTVDRLKVLRGRLPDPERPNEVIGDTKALSILGVRVGDTVRIRTVSQHQLDGFSVHLTADPITARGGRLVRLHVVGVAANARSDVDGGQMHLTPAFFRAYGKRRIGAFIEELVIRLRHGQADLPAFKQALGQLAGKRPFLLFEPSAGHPKIQHSIDLEARALWLVAVLAALGAIVIVGTALLRLTSDEAREDGILRALGADAGHQLWYAAARAVVIAVPAALVAVLVAYLCSAPAPIGWAHELDPRTGLSFDPVVIGAGAATVLVVLVFFGILGGIRALLTGDARRRPSPPRRADSPAIRFVRGHGSPAFGAGVRMALGSRAGRGATGTLAAAILAVAVTVTAFTFASSFHHLTGTPRLYGQTWDYETFGGPAQPKKIVDALTHTRGVTAVAAGADDTLAINGVDTGVRAWDNLKGSIAPTITKGRQPVAPTEVALAVKTLDAAHARVGDYVTVRGRGVVRRMHVVGQGVLPASKFNKLGFGGTMTFTALKRLDDGAVKGLYLMDISDGPGAHAAEKRLDFFFDGNVVVRPDEVGDFGRIDSMPSYIALLAAIAATAALAHALITTVRRSRRDLAVLKTLGFTRSQVAATVAWQASSIVAIALIAGVPLGLGAGRFAWRLFANDLGVAPEVVAPVLPVVLLVPIALIVANAVAALPGWFAARVQPAPVLRTE